MKRNFFKNSLAAFAFTLAIVASFAFTPVQDDLLPPVQGYIISTGEDKCVNSISTCFVSGPVLCTVDGTAQGTPVYRIHPENNTDCHTQLFQEE